MAVVEIDSTDVGIIPIKTDEILLNMGPQHPSTHGVLRLILRLDGEIVQEVTPCIGYLHRCAEKIAENVGYPGFIPYTDRMDYIAGMNANFGFVLAVEKLAKIEVPDRCHYIRMIMAELNRIASHLVAIGTFSLDTGSMTPFFYAFREREKIIDLFERVCGQRLTYSYYKIGGLMGDDLPHGWMELLGRFLDYFEGVWDEYNDLLTHNQIFIQRTANVGVMSADLAIQYGVTGPSLRGSGLKWDIRKDEPYSLYDRIDFEVPVGCGEKGTVGDCWDRYIVRMLEMMESVKIIRQCIKQMPKEGPISGRIPKLLKPAKNEIYFRSESPRGELGYYIVSDGTARAYRVKVRAPSFSNIHVIEALGPGSMIADAVVTVGSLDIVLGEIDR